MTSASYWLGPPALWPYRIDFPGPVIYVRAAVQITGPACVGFRIGDVYFRRRDLNYLDDIPDNPSSITVPCFAASVTQFATLAYTEPPDIIGIGSLAGVLAYTEPPDAVSIPIGGPTQVTQVLLTGTSWTPPTNYVSMVSVEAVGGGAGGGWSTGYGGGYAISHHPTIAGGTACSIQIGVGGPTDPGGAGSWQGSGAGVTLMFAGAPQVISSAVAGSSGSSTWNHVPGGAGGGQWTGGGGGGAGGPHGAGVSGSAGPSGPGGAGDAGSGGAGGAPGTVGGNGAVQWTTTPGYLGGAAGLGGGGGGGPSGACGRGGAYGGGGGNPNINEGAGGHGENGALILTYLVSS